MFDGTRSTYLEPTQEAGRAFFTRNISGSIVMLNLLRFRSVADYSATPNLAPAAPSAVRRLTGFISSTLCRTSRGRAASCSSSAGAAPS